MDVLSRAKNDLAEIERKLSELVPMQQRRDQLRTFISMAGNLFGESAQSSLLPQEPLRNEPPSAVVAKAGSAKAKILDAVTAIIESEGPMQTRLLVDRLLAQGVEIGGADKFVTISVLMSRARDKFKSDRAGGGWMLLSAHKEQPPQSVDAPAGV